LRLSVGPRSPLLYGTAESGSKQHRGGRGTCGSSREDSVRGAADGARAPVEDVSVDHGGADVVVAQELLDRSDVMAILQQMGGEGVPECVAAHALGDARSKGGGPDGTLEDGFVKVMTSAFAGGHRRTRRPIPQ
jgi:hypothetical protein